MNSTVQTLETDQNCNKWQSFNWHKASRSLEKTQARIVKAYAEGNTEKIAALQKLITFSFNSAAIAVKNTAESKGSKTAGVDDKHWNDDNEKYKAVFMLREKPYKHQPYKRIYIKKPNGGIRPLSIPTLQDRAKQALCRYALEPLAECTADKNSFGFRTGRRTHDALAECIKVLEGRAVWIMECDIERCFDNLDHRWLLKYIPIDQQTLHQILTCGYVDKKSNVKRIWPTTGASQGGPLSPVLCNMALDGLYEELKQHYSGAELIRYADDFVVTSSKYESMAKVLPVIEGFLRKRGLLLAREKTFITHVSKGFDFLGCTITKNDDVITIRPSEKSVKRIITKLEKKLLSSANARLETLAEDLNALLRGWANYFQYYDSMSIYKYIDDTLLKMLYLHNISPDIYNYLYRTESTTLKNYEQVKHEANPFDPAWQQYFEARANLDNTEYGEWF